MTKTVTIAATRTNGDPYAHHDVIVTLVAGSAGGVVGSNVIVEQSTVKLNASGTGSITLRTNDVEITSPSTSFYRFTVADSSPTITRSIRLTDDLPSSVSWTLAGIQVGDPTIPQRDVSSDYVTIGGQSLTNYLADRADAAAVVLFLAVATTDGTNTSWDVLAPDAAAEADGLVPAGWTSTVHLDMGGADFIAVAAPDADPDTVFTVLVPAGDAVGVWQFTPATIEDPWTQVDVSLAYCTAPKWFGAATDAGPWATLAPQDYDAVFLLADLRTEAAAHALAYADTDAVFDLCGITDGSAHNDRAWKTDPSAEFATGYWHRSLAWVEPFYRDGAYDGELVFSEDDTHTHDSEVGSWDNRERAWMRRWNEAEQRWYVWRYFEATPVDGTEETVRIFPNLAWTDGEFAYHVDLHSGWWVPEKQWLETACYFEFTGGPGGVWRHRELLRAYVTEPDVVLGGIGWRVHYDCHGDVPGSIDTGVTEPWSFGLDKGAIRMAWSETGESPDGPMLANPTAAGALAADPAGLSPFTDDAGNVWTPGPNAKARNIDRLTPAVFGMVNSDGGAVTGREGAIRVGDNGAFTLPTLTEADHGTPLWFFVRSTGATLDSVFVDGTGVVTDYPLTDGSTVLLRYYGYGAGYWDLVLDSSDGGVGGLDEAAVQALIDATTGALTATDVGADPAGTAAALVDDLSGVSDAATARTNLGLGTAATTAATDYATAGHNHTGTYQPLDSDLTSIAALTTTPFGRALLELADAAAARTALGTAYGTATGTVAEGISIASATWRTGNYYGAAIPISNAGNAMASGTVRAVPFFNPVAGRTIDQLAIDVFSASGTPAAILYICTDSNGYPGTVVASGSVTPAATSRQTASVSYTLPRGLLWLVAHSTAATWAGLALFGPTPYLPVNPTYSANPMSCWQVTGAGTSTLTSFPAGGTQSANGMQILLRAA